MKRETVLGIIKIAHARRVKDTATKKNSTSAFITKPSYTRNARKLSSKSFSVENYFLLEYKIAATAKSTDARAISGNA